MSKKPEKRTKPCFNCKKSKLKCEYTNALPCKRCVSNKLNCHYEQKLPSIKHTHPIMLPISQIQMSPAPYTIGTGMAPALGPTMGPGLGPNMGPTTLHHSQKPPSAPTPASTSSQPQQQSHNILHNQLPHNQIPHNQLPHNQLPHNQHNSQQGSQPSMVQQHSLPSLEKYDQKWKSNMENRLDSFDNKLDDLVGLLKLQQQQLLYQQQQQQQLQQFNQPQTQNYMQHHQPQHSYGAQQSNQHLSQNFHQQYHNYSSSAYTNGPVTPILNTDNKFHSQSSHTTSAAGFDTSPSSSQSDDSRRASVKSAQNKLPNENVLNADSNKRKLPEDFDDSFMKRSQTSSDDFRFDGTLSLEEAEELFSYFDKYISPQLFGFQVAHYSVKSIWFESPILIAAICTISSFHHPKFSSKSSALKMHLENLSSQVLFKTPGTEVEAFNTIIALCVAGFWLQNSHMVTGIALQLANNMGLNLPSNKYISLAEDKTNGKLSEKDRLKLWYLLYILDGQQSLAFNRKPLISGDDYSFMNSREMLVGDKELSTSLLPSVKKIGNGIEGLISHPTDEEKRQKELELLDHKSAFADLRLVSQVEYNQAINEVFKGNAWNMLAPAAFGIPSKTNLELDKWMVSWTVLLSPVNNGAVWSSKSTLIYYNFAKMHINSYAVRHLRTDGSRFPKWDRELASKSEFNLGQADMKLLDEHKAQIRETEEEDDDDDDEFISNDGDSEDNQMVSSNIAISAAQTVLNLVLSDEDILQNLKYVPVHIHIMLYYAALLILYPPSSGQDDDEEFANKVLNNFKLVKSLRRLLLQNLPIDKNFSHHLIKGIDDALMERLESLKREGQEINQIEELDDIETGSSNGSDRNGDQTPPGPEKISAWPGSHHGHP